MLEVNGLCAAYGKIQVLFDVNLRVPDGTIISIVGSNGAGKTTLLNTISAVVIRQSGELLWNGRPLSGVQHQVVKSGIVQVPEGRKVFAGLTVQENLIIGGYLNSQAENNRCIQEMYERFPILKDRRRQLAGTLSGGEQQMLAFARGLMSRPRLILLDEPSLGLAPIIVNQIFGMIGEIRDMGVSVLLVEQNATKALGICDYGYVLENGKIVFEGTPDTLLNNGDIRSAYLGTA